MNTKTLAAATLVLLGVADILNTLTILERGGVEVNPIMNYYLSIGNEAFILVKVFLTIGGAYILYKHSSTYVLLTLSAVYIIVILWQNYLIILR